MASETIAGSGAPGFAEGAGAAAQFDDPFGLAIDQDNNIIVADSSNHRIRRITSAGVVTDLSDVLAPSEFDVAPHLVVAHVAEHPPAIDA